MNDNIDDIDFSDPPGFVDDEDFMSDWIPKKPQETDGIDSVVVVDNIPQVGEKLFEKLQKVIKKIFDDFGTIVSEHYPVDDSGKTKGYIFLEYQNPNDALAAVKAIDGYKLDKNHTFTVNLFSDFDKYENIPDEWEPPQPQPYKDHGNLQSWLLEPHCYDQFSTIYDGGERTAIMQNTHNEPTIIEDRQRWTETYVKWSPRGTYLATFHGQGIALWGSEKFVQIMRFSHPGVQLIEFSPCEKYMISFSPNATHGDAPQAIIWDVFTGQKKRTFQCPQAASWPIFKWNSDGKYFARMAPDALSVYETPSFNLLDKKSIKVKGIRDFEWSPTDNYISYWTPEEREVPARVTLIEIPSRTQTSVKNLFTVADCKLHWQKSGDFLCVKLDRYKSKKEEKDAQIKYMGLYHNFNIFRIREKNIPVEIVELKESILAFAWEPVGNKFAVIQGDAPRISCVIYAVNEKGVEPLKTFDKITANHLFWSPMGQFLVLAGLRSMNGTLEFVDTSDMTTMNQAEHYLATDVEWDPTGRYVVTSVSFWGHKMENAYWIWNFQGKLLQKQPMENFCQFLWRPRPPTLLSSEQLKEVKRNVKKLYHRFQLEDKQRDSKVSKELIDKRRAVMKEYELWRARIDEIYEAERDRRLELRGGIDTDEMGNEEMLEETIEFLVKVEESLVTE